MLSGFEVIKATRTAGNYDSSYPYRILLHRTQGSTIDGAIGAYRFHSGWPHITCSYREQRKVQHIELGIAARALQNDPGDVQTNRARCIQIEMTGFSETPMSNAEADWLADNILKPIIQQIPIGLHGPRFYDDDEGIVLATESSPARMSSAVWRKFDGICGHQHCPENDHWDPGKIPLDRIIDRLEGKRPPKKQGFLMGLPDSKQDEMYEWLNGLHLGRQHKTYGRDWMQENLPDMIRTIVREEIDNAKTSRPHKTYGRDYTKKAVEPALKGIQEALDKLVERAEAVDE